MKLIEEEEEDKKKLLAGQPPREPLSVNVRFIFKHGPLEASVDEKTGMVWATIPGYPDYQIASSSKVRSKTEPKRFLRCGRGRVMLPHPVPGQKAVRLGTALLYRQAFRCFDDDHGEISLPGEEWTRPPVPYHSAHLIVSTEGRVIDERTMAPVKIRPYMLNSQEGFYPVRVKKDGEAHWMCIIQLVAFCFLGPRPSPLHAWDAINADFDDGRLVNVRWWRVQPGFRRVPLLAAAAEKRAAQVYAKRYGERKIAAVPLRDHSQQKEGHTANIPIRSSEGRAELGELFEFKQGPVFSWVDENGKRWATIPEFPDLEIASSRELRCKRNPKTILPLVDGGFVSFPVSPAEGAESVKRCASLLFRQSFRCFNDDGEGSWSGERWARPPKEYTCSRVIVSTYGRIVDEELMKELPLHQYRDGYFAVILVKNGKPLPEFVHRVMAFTFLGPAPTAQHSVDHINRRRNANELSNLRWAT